MEKRNKNIIKRLSPELYKEMFGKSDQLEMERANRARQMASDEYRQSLVAQMHEAQDQSRAHSTSGDEESNRTWQTHQALKRQLEEYDGLGRQ